jgi:mannose-1-phosphate guanylyltransferase
MQAVILVGGEGTRLRPLTLTRPKPALRLVDRPFIRFMVDWVGHHGVTEVVMACGFRPDDLREALGDRIPGGPSIRYVEEPEPLGTAGPIRYAADLGLLEERFLALNGDLLSDLDLSALIRLHEEREAVATLGLHPVDDPTSYGLVRRTDGPSAPGRRPESDGGEVLEFLEKPDPEQIDTDEVNAGTYVLDQRVVDLIPPGRAVSIEREVFPRLVGQGLYGRRLEGYWMDIGTPERYLQATWDILERRVETDVGARLDGAGLLVSDQAEVADGAAVSAPALVEEGCAVESGARVGARAVLGAGTEVGARAEIAGSVLDSGCSVGADAVLEGAILAPGVEVGERARIGSGAVIGEGAQIVAGTVIADGARVPPGEAVVG